MPISICTHIHARTHTKRLIHRMANTRSLRRTFNQGLSKSVPLCSCVEGSCLWRVIVVLYTCSYVTPIRPWQGTLVQQFLFSFKFTLSKAIIFSLASYPADIASFSSTNKTLTARVAPSKWNVDSSIGPCIALVDHFSSTIPGLSNSVWLFLRSLYYVGEMYVFVRLSASFTYTAVVDETTA